jgi:hypothetical protein
MPRKTPPKFSVGADVRVKRGVADPNFVDIPIGGWAGRITEMQYLNPPMYLIRWDQQTLDNGTRPAEHVVLQPPWIRRG